MRLLITVAVLSLMTVAGCKNKSADPAAEAETLNPEDFQSMFRTLNLPVSFSDSSLAKKPSDSAMSWKIYSQFIADSLVQKNFGKTAKPKLYASGKLVVKKGETYLFIKALGSAKKVLYLACLDKEGKFQTGMPLVVREEGSDLRYTSSIDNKYAISVSKQRREEGGKPVFVRTVYVYNAEGVFTLIMRESNESKPRPEQVYNPIDTLAHKHKFTGDYIQDKRNFISFRDGKNNNVLRVFIHFEKDNGNCKGELKGDVKFVSATTARYTASGDPCSLEFIFTEKSVRMKELEGCGNHRDIRCYFDGLYQKHKETPVKSGKPKRK